MDQAKMAFADAARGYTIAADTFDDNLEHRVNQARMLWASGEGAAACQSLSKLQGRYDAEQLNQLTSQLGCRKAAP
jgi:hypothetical protein